MIYGYCRVSTRKQSISRQRENIIREYPNAKIFEEVYTGTTSNRTAFQKLLKVVRAGDIIVFDSVSRMSRNAVEGIELYMQLCGQDIELVFLNERHIDTTAYKTALENSEITADVNTSNDNSNELIRAIFYAVNKFVKAKIKEDILKAFEQSEKEVKDLQQRTKEGMRVKNAGQKISKARQGKKFETAKNKRVKAVILQHSKVFGGNLKDKECIKLAECSEKTYYIYKKELLEEYDMR